MAVTTDWPKARIANVQTIADDGRNLIFAHDNIVAPIDTGYRV